VRPSVVEHLGASQAVLVVDETGLLKKGQHSAGVARHESGTAGRVANCQLGVFLTSAGPQGHGMLERELSLPKAWTNDAARCQGAGMPAARLLATKPQRAQQRLQRAFAQGVPAAWVTGDRVYGAHRSLRLWLEEHPHAHVLAISGKASVWRAGRPQQVKTILAAVAAEGWCRWRAGDGAKGPRG
jgi:SRSO17 transposase